MIYGVLFIYANAEKAIGNVKVLELIGLSNLFFFPRSLYFLILVIFL